MGRPISFPALAPSHTRRRLQPAQLSGAGTNQPEHPRGRCIPASCVAVFNQHRVDRRSNAMLVSARSGVGSGERASCPAGPDPKSGIILPIPARDVETDAAIAPMCGDRWLGRAISGRDLEARRDDRWRVRQAASRSKGKYSNTVGFLSRKRSGRKQVCSLSGPDAAHRLHRGARGGEEDPRAPRVAGRTAPHPEGPGAACDA